MDLLTRMAACRGLPGCTGTRSSPAARRPSRAGWEARPLECRLAPDERRPSTVAWAERIGSRQRAMFLRRRRRHARAVPSSATPQTPRNLSCPHPSCLSLPSQRLCLEPSSFEPVGSHCVPPLAQQAHQHQQAKQRFTAVRPVAVASPAAAAALSRLQAAAPLISAALTPCCLPAASAPAACSAARAADRRCCCRRCR